MDYLVYAYLQLAQDRQARDVVGDMNRVQGFNPEVRTGLFALAASPARYMVERSHWKGAAELPVRSTRFAYVDAITHFARALGAARSGDIAAAKLDITKLAELCDKLRAANDAYWAEQADIQLQIATSWVVFAEGKRDDAVPGNVGLSERHKLARVREIFQPYHDRIATELDRRREAARPTALISVHSFTPVFKTVARLSASSRLFDLNGEANSVNKKHSSATIVADVIARSSKTKPTTPWSQLSFGSEALPSGHNRKNRGKGGDADNDLSSRIH